MIRQQLSVITSTIAYYLKTSASISLLLLLSGCNSDNHDISSSDINNGGIGKSDTPNASLEKRLADIRLRPSGQIESLPERLRQDRQTYTSKHLRDPFSFDPEVLAPPSIAKHPEPTKPSISHEKPASNKHPRQHKQSDNSREKTSLENQPLETLILVGTLQYFDEASPTALIDSGQGDIKTVIVGQYLGQNFGRVTKIQSDTVFIEESVQDEQGVWIKRPKQLKLMVIKDEITDK
jgi:type IV pilus assembly protein PilP